MHEFHAFFSATECRRNISSLLLMVANPHGSLIPFCYPSLVTMVTSSHPTLTRYQLSLFLEVPRALRGGGSITCSATVPSAPNSILMGLRWLAVCLLNVLMSTAWESQFPLLFVYYAPESSLVLMGVGCMFCHFG